MTRGRRRTYNESCFVGLRCEKFYVNVMEALKIKSTDVYVKGALTIMAENADKLSPEQLQVLIQEKRARLKELQENIALCERILMDADIREERRKRQEQRTITMHDENGRAIKVVTAE